MLLLINVGLDSFGLSLDWVWIKTSCDSLKIEGKVPGQDVTDIIEWRKNIPRSLQNAGQLLMLEMKSEKGLRMTLSENRKVHMRDEHNRTIIVSSRTWW